MWHCRSLLLLILGGAALSISVPACAATERISPDTAYEYQRYPAAFFDAWQPRTALDMVLRLPDTSLQQNRDGQLQVQLHGMDSSYLAILIDGHPLPGNGDNNNRTLEQIPASLIGAVEVYPNGISDLDARGGAAGSINLQLKHHHDPALEMQLQVGGEPLNSAAAFHIASQFDVGQLNLVADAGKARRQITAEDSSRLSSTDDRWSSQLSDDSQAVHLRYDTPSDFPVKFSSTINYFNNDQQQRNQNRQRNDDKLALSSQRDRFQSWRLNNLASGHYHNTLWQTQLLLENYHEEEKINSGTLQLTDQRIQLAASLAEQLDEHHWKAGLRLASSERELNSQLSDNIASQVFDFRAEQHSLHAYALDRWQLTRNIQFEAGFRMETYQLKQIDRTRQLSSRGEQETTGNTLWLPSFHLMYRYSDEWRLGASASQSARHPDLSQRIPYQVRQGDIELRGNGKLDAEVVSAMDARLEFRSRARRADFVTLRAVHRTINNAILDTLRSEQRNGETITVIEPQNSLVSGIQQGLELDGGYQLSTATTLRFAMAGYRSYLRATGTNETQRLANQPSFRTMLSIHHNWQPIELGGQWRFQGLSEEQLNDLDEQDEVLVSDIGHALELYLHYRQFPAQPERGWQWGLTASQLLNDDRQLRSAEAAVRFHQSPLWQLSVKRRF